MTVIMQAHSDMRAASKSLAFSQGLGCVFDIEYNRFMSPSSLQSICVYCGSADGVNPDYLQAAHQMGQALAQRGIRLVYGAGKTGLMGAVADGVLQAGGEVTGIVPSVLNSPQLIHAGLTQLEVVDTIHQRKARMAQLADALVALPGGYGTFEELFEQLTWVQIGLHKKPIGLLNVKGYFNPLITLVEHALSEGFIYTEHRVLLVSSSQPSDLLDALVKFQPPNTIERWVNR
jgi:uncharacterized protein (TIGR00730 family)